MTDEANVHVYAMVDQLIEGHQWLKDNLNYTPTTGFSIDPFGHGSTLPYLLAASEFEGTIIQRIHYAWKQFMARERYGIFVSHSPMTFFDLINHFFPFQVIFIGNRTGKWIMLHQEQF